MCMNLEHMKGRLNQFLFALDNCESASFLRLVWFCFTTKFLQEAGKHEPVRRLVWMTETYLNFLIFTSIFVTIPFAICKQGLGWFLE